MLQLSRKLTYSLLSNNFKLRNSFSKLSKHEKMINKNPHVKDLTQNPVVKVNIEDARNQFKRDTSIDGVKLLSEAAQRTKREVKLGKEIKIDNQKISKEIRKYSYKAIDKAHYDSYDYLVDNDYLQLNMSKMEENKRLIQELKEFKKLYFEKKEIKRLLKQQERQPENYLPQDLIGQQDIENAQRFKAYKESNKYIKNERIQNMLEGNQKENKKLSLLISSGLLDTSKNIKQIITSSTELLMQDMKNNPNLYNKNSQNVYQDIVLEKQNNQDNQTIDIQDENLLENQDVTVADNNVVPINDHSQLSLINNDKDRTKLLELYGEKISQMGFDITLDELNFVDFETLALFFDEFVNSTPDEKIKTLNKMQFFDNIRTYENYLFDKKRNHDITLRVKGRLEFKDLSEKENLNYIKYNIVKPSEIFLMIQNMPEQVLTPGIISQSVTKLASFKFKGKENYLALINNFNYRSLLRHCVNNCNQMSDTEFVDLMWSLGKIHKDEHGLVYERLFNKLVEASTEQIKQRIGQLQLKEISFMSRGYLKLHHFALNEDLNKLILSELRERLEKREGEDLTIFGIQGLMLYMSFLKNDESKELMANYLVPLLHKDEIIQGLDDISLSEICQSLASISQQNPQLISSYFDKATQQIINISKKLKTDTISDLMIVASSINYQNKPLFQELKKRTIFNLREQKECSEISISKILCSFAQFDVVKSLQKHVDVKESSNTNLTDNLLLFSLFPTLVFQQQSPQYLFYNKLAKEIDQVKDKMNQKWIAMSIFGIASAQYKNLEFIDDCVKVILQSHEQTEINNEQQIKKQNNNLNELSMLLFAYSNMKRSNEQSRKLIELIRNLFIQNKFFRATPIAWAQFFNALANTNQKDELDEVEQQFAEIVYFDKIQSHVHVLTQNIILSLLFSFSRLRVEKEIVMELISYINLQKLNNFQLYIYNISLQLNGLSKVQSLPQIQSSASLRIKEIELYMKNIMSQKLDFYGNQRFNYLQVMNQIKQIISQIVISDEQAEESNQEKVQENYFDDNMNMMIDFYLPKSKKAILVYTYDNCLMQQHIDEKSVSNNNLSGLFQAKEQILSQNGISVHRVFVHEFNSIGLKSTIEGEKKLKYKYIEDILKQQN